MEPTKSITVGAREAVACSVTPTVERAATAVVNSEAWVTAARAGSTLSTEAAAGAAEKAGSDFAVASLGAAEVADLLVDTSVSPVAVGADALGSGRLEFRLSV
jgi:hypothetical protein